MSATEDSGPPTVSTPGFQELANEAYQSFNDTLDFLWKSPRLIDSEEQIERQKLDAYFGNDVSMRAFRWEHESRRLHKVFPFLLAAGNLFAVLSLLELYLLRLSVLAEHITGRSTTETPGQGYGKMLSYFRKLGVLTHQIPSWPQIDAAFKIRNCLMHAGGLVGHSRDEVEVRRLVKAKSYLEQGPYRDSSDNTDYLVSIVSDPIGERLQVAMLYPFLLCAYARAFYLALTAALDTVLSTPPN